MDEEDGSIRETFLIEELEGEELEKIKNRYTIYISKRNKMMSKYS